MAARSAELNILITGAAGNLGALLAGHMKDMDGVHLHLMVHRKDVGPEFRDRPDVTVHKADLAEPKTLSAATTGVDVIVHFAGVLFKARPEKFLPTTNTVYFKNLVDAAIENKVRRIILISFPHVEGETTKENPATGRLDGNPLSVHAKTRLAEEKYLFEAAQSHRIEAVSLRVGMVYGKGILMIEGARQFAKRRLLGIWKKPTYIHLISTVDFLGATAAAALKENISGIYHLGDDGYQTLQQLLTDATAYWGYGNPWTMPLWMIMAAARLFEFGSRIFGVRSPLTRDFVRIGTSSYYGDTTRMKQELLPTLQFPTYKDGLSTL